jgi:hypothetical protein
LVLARLRRRSRNCAFVSGDGQPAGFSAQVKREGVPA